MNTYGYDYVALNGADHTDRTDAIARKHAAEAEAFLAAHADELKAFDHEERLVSYGAEYFHEVGGVDDDGEYSVAATIDAHDLSTDDYDKIELHGIYNMADIAAYRPIGTGDQSKRARDLVLIDTREEATRECRAQRAEQLQRHMTGPRQTRGERIVKGKQSESERRNIIRERAAAKRAKRAARYAASKA